MGLIHIGDPLPARGWAFDGITHVNKHGPAFIASRWWPAYVFDACACRKEM